MTTTTDPQAPYAIAAWARDGWTIYPAAAPKSLCVKVLASHASDEEGAALAERLLSLLNAAPLTGATGEGETRLSPERLAELRATVEAERTGWDGQPFDKLGFWPAAVDDLLADLASARARLQEETRAAAEARERAAELMAGLLMEWMDETEPHSLTYDNPDEFLKDQGVHRKFFQLKAAACGLGWPLHEATIGISAALPLVGEEGKEGQGE